MTELSGYDSEAIGFESVSQAVRSEMSSGTQTCFEESGTASQTNISKDCGSMATPEELEAQDDILKEYPPPGLNEFLRKILTALNFYARGGYQGSVAQNMDGPMAQQTVCRCLQEVTNALNAPHILRKYIKFPQNRNERNSIKRKFYEKYGLPGVIGCIDCTHIAIVRPSQQEEQYFNRKHFHSLNTQVVVPAMMEHLDERDKELLYNSSDSEEEEVLSAKLVQEIQVDKDVAVLGSGDHQTNILSMSWSSAGNSLAVSIGQDQHQNWCQHDGLIRIYTIKRSENDKLVHSIDISEKNCVSVVKYHPSVSAMFAYATVTGEIVICNLQDTTETGLPLTSPADCHGSKRVTALKWADASLANMFLMMQINKTGKRRGASDQILFSSGSDGTINVWQVNINLKVFENVVSYNVNGSKKLPALDITCFDFIKSYPLRPSDEKISDDIFVVGTKTGQLYLCKIKTQQFNDKIDPVYDALEGHSTCVLDIVFSFQKPGVFVSMSIDSEMRIYDVNQPSPLKVLCLDVPVTCMSWLPNNTYVFILGLAKAEKEIIKVYNVSSGRPITVDGLVGTDCVTAITVAHTGNSCRVAVGDDQGKLKLWELPSRRIRLSPEDLDF